MALSPLPALDRTSPTFKTELDAYFLTALPAFSTEANALQADVVAKQVLASAAAVTAQAAIDAGLANAAANAATATTQAGTATTKASEALASANAAAASAASIAGGPVASINGMTGVVTGIATGSGTANGTNTGDQTTVTGNAGTATALSAGADRTKLDGIAAGANNYTHPANHPASVITQDASNRFVTDAEKTTWNAKIAAASYASSTTGGTLKVRLNGTSAYFTINGSNA